MSVCPVCNVDHALEAKEPWWKRLFNIKSIKMPPLPGTKRSPIWGYAIRLWFIQIMITFIGLAGNKLTVSFLIFNIELGFTVGLVGNMTMIREALGIARDHAAPPDEKQLAKQLFTSGGPKVN